MIESRLAATEEKLGEIYLPRIIRLCRKYEFSKKETELAIYALFVQCGYKNGSFGHGESSLAYCELLDISLKDAMEFLHKDRLHMQQGVFPNIQNPYIFCGQLSYDTDFCQALMGFRVGSNAFIKLEQTLLADVIKEEPGNERYRYSGTSK